MNTSDKVEMEFYIAGNRLSVKVPEDRRNVIRDAERNLNAKFMELRKQFPKKGNEELLAMVAYQFAYNYYDRLADYEKAYQTARNLDETLNKLLG